MPLHTSRISRSSLVRRKPVRKPKKNLVFVRFRLSDQLRSSVDQINDFGVFNVADPETWVFRKLKYSHMCRL
ncbi:hypothetical protein MTR_5g093400 [Medicago truncatula]|uniref:Uncharacterized protein n=1 Tax=Medicago truncatula TaxID=3880 RepID=G7K8K7_MEDTR|nr:hypothetical protein MTR_5g093400 [Medicago truncatula]